jgi:hypothetical protein
MIEHIARHEHERRVLAQRQRADALDGIEPRAPQQTLVFAIAAEGFADLPIRRVYEAHGAGPVGGSDHLIRFGPARIKVSLKRALVAASPAP